MSLADKLKLKPWERAHLAGMARLGLNELRGLFYAESPIKETDLAIFGRATPGEVSQQRNPGQELAQEDHEKAPNLFEAKLSELRERGAAAPQPQRDREPQR